MSGDPSDPAEIALADSATDLDEGWAGKVVVCASHGGRYPAALAARYGVRAIALNDAGVGLDGAGVAGLALLDEHGIPAVGVHHRTARLGDAADTMARGRVSHLNPAAERLGCTVGMTVADAAGLLARKAPPSRPADVDAGEARHLVLEGPPAVWALDSASLVNAGDAGAVVLTGSHAGLIGGDPARALKAGALAAVFNDAGAGDDEAGLTRLPALDARAIPAAAVAAGSARIGDGRSTYEDGVLSAVNSTARSLGASEGMAARDFVDLVINNMVRT